MGKQGLYFFKLDFYDSPDDTVQNLYLSIILPIQQGLTQTASLSLVLKPVASGRKSISAQSCMYQIVCIIS